MDQEIDIEFLKTKYPKFLNCITGDPKPIQDQLCIASLFLMAYESFQDFVIEHFRDFFSDGYQRNKEGNIIPTLGENYNRIYEEFSKGEKKNKTMMAACKWFHSHGAITDDELECVRLITHIRNDLAHELFAVIADDSKSTELEADIINIPINLFFKVSNWWIREIEASIIPENFEGVDEEAMAQVKHISLDLLLCIKDRVLNTEKV